ncbi:uncharacterized protein BDCG_07552 [Blastomyces dermatitidis ER-3]|uniref:Methyltransferase n=1 Tax=Ajellomyces dermatitidis (strain ER-3 / ATCC MYA-2586) TaxID=559297 RepID=A0ABM9YIR6_AJEDR|nr:uncharacterized protein BDCG_07552 [Blastomyces dermatitidis ER-3]EEQ92432.1 hypothetical protein BDCG_07552 [Blastomyces dermatitidis ER-3]
MSATEPAVVETSTPAPVNGVGADSVVEVDDADDAGFAYGDDDSDSAVSASITSSIVNYEYANGRRYAGYRRGEYLLPNDETEQDRLDLLHHVFLLLNDGKLLRAPIGPIPQRALDIGTSTGIWALAIGEERRVNLRDMSLNIKCQDGVEMAQDFLTSLEDSSVTM